MSDVLVIKQDMHGNEQFRYPGRVLRSGNTWVQLQAVFQRATQRVGPLQLAAGDRLVELFYTDRWFNIFAVFAGEDGALRGWYCNIAYPADITPDMVVQRDLALDLVVLPDGSSEWLDHAEYEALALPKEDQLAADAAARELETLAAARRAPFHASDPTALVDSTG